MSQEKVDRYKKQKANRKQIMQREKREKMLWKIGGSVVAIALVAWVGFSAFDRFYEPPRKFYVADTAAISDYLTNLASEDAAEEVADAVDEALAGDDEETSEAVESETDAAESETDAAESETDAAESETNAAQSETAES